MNDLRGAMGKARANTIVANTIVPIAGEDEGDSRLPSRLRKWGSEAHLSSAVARLEALLADRGFERMPWLAVAMLAGIGIWFALPGPGDWLIALGLCGLPAGLALIALRGDDRALLRNAAVAMPLMIAAGIVLIWARSALIGTEPVAGPRVAVVEALVLEREEQPARERVRLIVATRDPLDARPIRARLNVPVEMDDPRLTAGAQFRAKLRLIPPQRAAVPGGYDFARAAWFDGLAASGSLLEQPAITREGGGIAGWRSRLAAHVREQVGRFGGTASAAIAATLITGDRGAIPDSDGQAMRDAGLAHMLSISGLHVGAIVAIAWLLVVRVGALFPWLALRVRLPLAAAGTGAVAGIAYTLLTGAALPTVRACLAALLVVGALALGRQALSLRLIALAAMGVMLFWPEAVIGPSFQLSFAAVIAIVTFHNSRFVAWLRGKRGEGRGEGRLGRLLHAGLLLFLTGLVVEAALTPLVLFHFQRSGVYGSLANVIAIPLMTGLTLPVLIGGLVFDAVGWGAPFWWAGAKSLDLIIALAHGTSSLPGAVLQLPQIALCAVLACVAGGLWLALWSGRLRLWGLAPLAIGLPALFLARPADLLIEQSGRNAALLAPDGRLYLLRNSTSFSAEAMVEAMGKGAQYGVEPFAEFPEWPGARCNGDFCQIEAEGRVLLVAQRPAEVPYGPMVAACARADIVIASRRLPADCQPAMLKADSSLLARRGGLAVDLSNGTIRAVRPQGDRHGW
jgi:competence protein ComEC